MQLDDPHETVHNHNAVPAAIEAAKMSARMRDAVRSAPGARPTAVLASGPGPCSHGLATGCSRTAACEAREAFRSAAAATAPLQVVLRPSRRYQDRRGDAVSDRPLR